MELFEHCHKVNDYLMQGEESAARNELILLLENLQQNKLEYSPLVNHLIREVGLFPYLHTKTCSWEERYIFEVFKADVGEVEPRTLHREQSRLLYALLKGQSIVVSAPTSFGKSFVIDSFISIKSPQNVVIIVPTIALADETRRRLQRKFKSRYKIITTSDQSLGEKNILIFPQERALGYLNTLKHIDILIIDEFYKASRSFDKERSPALVKAILDFSKISSQRYFLAPNIHELKDNQLTKEMEFLCLDFNTVVLKKFDLTDEIGNDKQKKSEILLRILKDNLGKTLIYAGTYTNVEKLSELLMTNLQSLDLNLLNRFKIWLENNYDPNWALTTLVEKGVGIHNGRLHRSISQVQIRLFEEDNGLGRLISTSSIIEGVNTSAENIVLWSNKNGSAKINNFTFKNIIGRGGRMFRHFVGKIFILESPPNDESVQLDLDIPQELLGGLDGDSASIDLTTDQVAKIEEHNLKMRNLVGVENFKYFRDEAKFQSSNYDLIFKIAKDIVHDKQSWNGLIHLNSSNPNEWDHYLYKLVNLKPGWGTHYRKYVKFVKILSENWVLTIPQLLQKLKRIDIKIEKFFELERDTTFTLASLLSDVQIIYNRINHDHQVNLTSAISKFSHAFLPVVVYQLEEYGIPRMISRKINEQGLIDLEGPNLNVHMTLDRFVEIGYQNLIESVREIDEFDRYILKCFYEGI